MKNTDTYIVVIDIHEISDADAEMLGINKNEKTDMMNMTEIIRDRITEEFKMLGVTSIPVHIETVTTTNLDTALEFLADDSLIGV